MLLVCVLLLGGTSVVQACHSHEDLSATHSTPLNVPSDHCLLCMAMHSAMPVAAASSPLFDRVVHALPREAPEVGPSGIWSFDLFSRPPPAAVSPA